MRNADIVARGPMGMRTHVAVGTDLSTRTGARYAHDFTPALCDVNPDACTPTEIYYGTGDGTVNVQSALVTRELPSWAGTSYFNVSGETHLGLVSNAVLIKWVMGIVLPDGGS